MTSTRAYRVTPRTPWTACLILFACLVTTGAPTFAESTAQMVSERQVKAAMLFKFLGYTDWPTSSFPSAEASYRIWVLGDNEMAEELRAMTSDRKIEQRPVQIFRTSNPERLSSPHVVFVGSRAERYLPELALMAEQESFLLVTERQEGLGVGSVINLRLVDGRIGFDVSLINAHKSNLKLSARLLSVALSVEQEAR